VARLSRKLTRSRLGATHGEWRLCAHGDVHWSKSLSRKRSSSDYRPYAHNCCEASGLAGATALAAKLMLGHLTGEANDEVPDTLVHEILGCALLRAKL
jgi:hypothetical protein